MSSTNVEVAAADSDALRQKLREHIEAVKVCMLTTSQSDGLHSRPMLTLQFETDGTLWFFVRPHSNVATAVGANRDVNVSYADHDDGAYATLSGHAYLIDDPEKAEELWNDTAAAWFPDGPTASHLIRVDVRTAEYWKTAGGTFDSFLSVAKSALGEAVEPESEHHILRF